jgi:hypothetical protein
MAGMDRFSAEVPRKPSVCVADFIIVAHDDQLASLLRVLLPLSCAKFRKL